MTPALTAARELFPHAQIDVLVRGGTAGILRGSLALDNIYTTAAPEKNKRGFGQLIKDIRLLSRLRKEKYDWVFELGDNDRGRFMALCLGGKNLAAHNHYGFPFWAYFHFKHKSNLDYGTLHRCQKDVELLRAFCGYKAETPKMQFDRSFVDWSWAQAHLKGAPIVIHPVTRWRRKMWPIEKWMALVRRLSAEAPIVLTSGPSPDEVTLTRQIASVAPQRVITTDGTLDWAQMAGLLYSARLLVSVDTATMHLGAACQTPLVAIFGPTPAQQWGPWKAKNELILPPESATLTPPEQIIRTIEVETVWKACERMLLGADAPKH